MRLRRESSDGSSGPEASHTALTIRKRTGVINLVVVQMKILQRGNDTANPAERGQEARHIQTYITASQTEAFLQCVKTLSVHPDLIIQKMADQIVVVQVPARSKKREKLIQKQ